jgi:hypothetical protein
VFFFFAFFFCSQTIQFAVAFRRSERRRRRCAESDRADARACQTASTTGDANVNCCFGKDLFSLVRLVWLLLLFCLVVVVVVLLFLRLIELFDTRFVLCFYVSCRKCIIVTIYSKDGSAGYRYCQSASVSTLDGARGQCNQWCFGFDCSATSFDSLNI